MHKVQKNHHGPPDRMEWYFAFSQNPIFEEIRIYDQNLEEKTATLYTTATISVLPAPSGYHATDTALEK